MQAALAILRVIFLLPSIRSFFKRERIVYSFIPWSWEVGASIHDPLRHDETDRRPKAPHPPPLNAPALTIHSPHTPPTNQMANVALATARLVFLLSELNALPTDYAFVVGAYLSVLLQAACLEHLRSSAPRERHILLVSVNRAEASTRCAAPRPLGPILPPPFHQPHLPHHRTPRGITPPPPNHTPKKVRI
jgi:hypothetical protein